MPINAAIPFFSSTMTMLLDGQSVARISHAAAGMGSHDVLRHRTSVPRVHIDDFMQTLGYIFRHDSHRDLYNLDLVACMLQDCYGIVLESDQWSSFKQKVLTNVRSEEPAVPAWGLQSFDAPTPTVDVERQQFRKRSFSHQSSASLFDLGSNDTDLGSDLEVLSNPSSSRSVRTKTDSDMDSVVTALKYENLVLRRMLEEQQAKTKAKDQTIKILRRKAVKKQNSLGRLCTSMRKVKNKDMAFCPTRVAETKFVQQQCRRLEHGRVEEFLKKDGDDDAEDITATDAGYTRSMGWFTPQGCISLAIRRNLSNISAEDLGLVTMHDVSKQTVLRAECRTGAALLANSRAFFQEFLHYDSQMDDSSLSFLVVQYRQDATNSSKHRQKMSALEIDASFAICSSAAEMDALSPLTMNRIRRLADVQPVHSGYETGAATMALSQKMLESIGCPTWDHFLNERNLLNNSPSQRLVSCSLCFYFVLFFYGYMAVGCGAMFQKAINKNRTDQHQHPISNSNQRRTTWPTDGMRCDLAELSS